VTIRFRGQDYACPPGDSVLDALLKGGAELAYSCRNGICQSCVLRAPDAAVPADVQGELKETLRARGCFLACLWRPGDDALIELEALDDAELFVSATVTETASIGKEMCRLRLDPAVPLYYHAGQFINLRGPHGAVRSYSLASVPALDRGLEIHVRRLPGGAVSNWLHDEVRVGQQIAVEGPFGDCFYLPGRAEQPLLMVATGSGAAPLSGIVRDALRAGHQGPIRIYHGSRSAHGIYLHEQFQALQREHPNLQYVAAVSGPEVPSGFHAGRADALALQQHPDLRDHRVYLCGSPPMVKGARRKCYLAGAAMADIHVDPFELTDLRTQPR
jgi:ferredoxin-NADP reductase/ferredoxin